MNHGTEDVERVEVDVVDAYGQVIRTATAFPRPGETLEHAVERATYSARTGRLSRQ
ncbi:hypothetical protein [Streptomyces sp. HUAS TT7]|uniref:hypothetical protein n=1 Tax=Streptomyces sp. HUAS TT7 TaxID=3447507 RepID=UPI003F655E1D